MAVKLAEPDVRVPVPRVAVPEEKVTAPVAAAGATVAVRVKLAPAATGDPDVVRVVVVGVVPVLLPVPTGGSQKPLHPARLSASSSVAAVIGNGARVRLLGMVSPPFVFRFLLRCRPGGEGPIGHAG